MTLRLFRNKKYFVKSKQHCGAGAALTRIILVEPEP
jgi:hypothetical protein